MSAGFVVLLAVIYFAMRDTQDAATETLRQAANADKNRQNDAEAEAWLDGLEHIDSGLFATSDARTATDAHAPTKETES
jgi:hypothetical protein